MCWVEVNSWFAIPEPYRLHSLSSASHGLEFIMPSLSRGHLCVGIPWPSQCAHGDPQELRANIGQKHIPWLAVLTHPSKHCPSACLTTGATVWTGAGRTCLSVFIEISSENIWLLFLPLCPVPVKTPVVLSIVVLVLLLAIASFVLLGHLLIFHLYLSMYPP